MRPNQNIFNRQFCIVSFLVFTVLRIRILWDAKHFTRKWPKKISNITKKNVLGTPIICKN